MGLDMYLKGRKSLWSIDGAKPRMEDGFEVSDLTLDLGYWRKHPNLHGYIVQTFADGVDECQKIDLNADAMRNIIAAIKEKRLPHTDGFFFGASDGSEQEAQEAIDIFTKAIDWLTDGAAQADKRSEFFREVYYQASW